MPVNFSPRPPLAPLRKDVRFIAPPSLAPQFGGIPSFTPGASTVISDQPQTVPPPPPPPPPPPGSQGPKISTNSETGRQFYEESPAMYDEQGNMLQEAVWKPLAAASERVSPYETANAQFDLAQRMRGLEAIVDTPWGEMTAQEAAAMRNYNLPPPPTLAEQTAANVEQERQLRGEGLGTYYQGPPTEYQQGLLSEQRLTREQTGANQARQAELEQWRLQGWRPGTAEEVAAYYASLDKLRRSYGGR